MPIKHEDISASIHPHYSSTWPFKTCDLLEQAATSESLWLISTLKIVVIKPDYIPRLNLTIWLSDFSWYKLLDKSSKADKERGEVLLDIQFMRNNMTASMFDLSITDKPRSRISKLKDKVRGKKKDGLSDSASAIVLATVNQVLTESEGEEEENTDSPKLKKTSKFKTLFGSKTNLHKGVSQSMSTLGTLPEKNSSLSSSRSSGLNEEFAEGKDKKRVIKKGNICAFGAWCRRSEYL